jgi:hypothetical protein
VPMPLEDPRFRAAAAPTGEAQNTKEATTEGKKAKVRMRLTVRAADFWSSYAFRNCGVLGQERLVARGSLEERVCRECVELRLGVP